MKDKDFATILICTYGRADSLRRTLETLLPNNVDDACEVVVVDNNSKDHTQDVLKEYAARYPDLFRHYFEKTQGRGAALNTGIAAARGDVIIFADDDLLLPENWLAEIRRALREHPECSVFGGKVIPVLPDGMTMPEWVYRIDPKNIAEGPLVDHNRGDAVRSYHERGMCTPIGAMTFFRREVLSRHGLFEETVGTTGRTMPNEDSIWGMRLKRAGEPMLYIPSVYVHHVTDPARLTKEYFRRYFWKSGQVCTYWTADDAESKRRRLLNVPREFYLKLVRAVGSYLAAQARRESPGLRFARELDVIFFASVVSGFLRERRTGS